MESDEDEYMSDKFLQNDHTPGLMPKMFLDKHKRVEVGRNRGTQQHTRSFKAQAAEKRDEKLNTALDENNKGFALLSKMGFKAGMGLGKDGQGRSEPIPLKIIEGRKGLGKDAEINEKKEKKMKALQRIRLKRRALEDDLRSGYKSRMKSKTKEREIQGDIYRSQKACEDLDTKKNINCKETWMWMPRKTGSDCEGDLEEEDEGTEPDNEEKLELLTKYLRETHNFCIWCGIEYQNGEDIQQNCPGNSRGAHDD